MDVEVFKNIEIWFLDMKICVIARKECIILEDVNEPFSSHPGLLHEAVPSLAFNSSTCQHLPLCFKERCCVSFTLLPGDSFGFDFWKAWVNQSAVCCGFIPPIGCDFVPTWAGFTFIFFFCHYLPTSSGSGGWRGGHKLRLIHLFL